MARKKNELPEDFGEVLKTIEKRGITREAPGQIHNRLVAAVEGEKTLTKSAEVLSVRPASFITEVKQAIYREICDPEKKELKKKYMEIFDATLTTQGITSVASTLTTIVSAINPGLAVSTVLAFLAIWIIKIGANQWCSKGLPK